MALALEDRKSHYDFKSNEGFMRFLRGFNSDWPDWWECEYSDEHLNAMYQAYLHGMLDGAAAVRLEVEARLLDVETQLTRRTL